jgi:hypothetical protein
VSAEVQIHDAAGRRVVWTTVEPTFADPHTIKWTIPLTGLAPGGYTLHVVATDGTHSVERQIGFAIDR